MKLTEIINTVEIIEKYSPDFTINMLRVFLYVAVNPDKTQKEIQQDLNINIGTISRVVLSLTEGGSKKKGLRLLKGVLNTDDYRSRTYFLTNKGLKLIAELTGGNNE